MNIWFNKKNSNSLVGGHSPCKHKSIHSSEFMDELHMLTMDDMYYTLFWMYDA